MRASASHGVFTLLYLLCHANTLSGVASRQPRNLARWDWRQKSDDPGKIFRRRSVMKRSVHAWCTCFAVLIAVLALSPLAVYAQQTLGSIDGTVTDST